MSAAAGPGAVLAGLLALAGATAGLGLGIEPFATWYYQFAWYSLLLALDGLVAWTGAAGRKGEFLLLSHPAHLASLLGWSAVVWFFYELWNFRLQNWYYVNLPHGALLRWGSTALAFATVLPAIFLATTLLQAGGLARTTRWRPLRVTGKTLTGLRAASLAMAVLVLAWPRYFFPLVWGATTLLVEPWVYQRAPRRSLLHDLELGQPGRLLRLLLAGGLVGFVWELLNIGARTKWIYTVPFLEELKLFEMPVPGFLGFPPFAVECFVLWQALVVLGVAVPRFGRRRPVTRLRQWGSVAAAAGFCLLVSRGMDTRTVASLRPRLADLGVPERPLRAQGLDAFRLAETPATRVAKLATVDEAQAADWVERARLATMRGVGVEGVRVLETVGITTVEALAAVNPAQLIRELERNTGEDLVDARVRVWVRGARRLVSPGAAP